MNSSISQHAIIRLTTVAIMVVMPFTTTAQSFLKKIKSKAEQTATEKILNQTDKAVSKSMDKAIDAAVPEQKSKEEDVLKEKKAANDEQELIEGQGPQKVQVFSKYDFVPGDSILYINDFSNEAVGELPTNWNSNGSSVVVKLDGLDGQWLRMAQRTVCLTDNRKLLGPDFTVEFDLFLQFDFKGWLPPSLRFGLLASGNGDPGGNGLLSDPKGEKSFYMEISPLSGGANVMLESYTKFARYFYSPPHKSPLAEKWYGRVLHVSIQGQKERLRIWMDGEKMYDVPKAIPLDGVFNQLFFQLSSSPYQDDQIGVYMSNIKIARGLPDTRHKLIDEGKFSTTGILFDPGSATIQATSAGVLQSIANVLAQNQAMKVRIIGHTDAAGNEQANQQLSEQRARAVKENLQNSYHIAADRLEAIGKGESAPVADNNTKEGMAQNRRVEFIRL